MPESATKSVTCIYAFLALTTILVFWQVHSYGFVHFDDNTYIFENPNVTGGLSVATVRSAFAQPQRDSWLPLTWLSLALDRDLFGMAPGPMHLVNAMLHLLNTLLLFALLKRMTSSIWPSAFVAAAFALHPLHVESVAWISERKDVLSTFFLLLTLLAYVTYAHRRSPAYYLLAILLFASGLLAKPMLVTLPFLLLLLDYWPLCRFQACISARRLAFEKLPFFAMAIISSVVTFLVQRAAGSVADTLTLSLSDRFANAFLSFFRYIARLFWPADLSVFYPLLPGDIRLWQGIVCALLLLAISAIIVRLARTRSYLAVGWFWFLISLLPVIGFVQVGSQAYADRYTYIPYIGLFIMLAWGLPDALSGWRWRNLVLALMAAVTLPLLAVLSYVQTGYWKDSRALFTHALKVTSNNYVAYGNLGAALNGLGQWKDAVDSLTRAIAIKPDYAEAYNNRGSAYGNLNQPELAIDDFRQAIAIRPSYAAAWHNLATACSDTGHNAEAIDAYSEALRLEPGRAETHYDFANKLAAYGRTDEAVQQYRLALQLRPDWADCMNNLAFAIATNPHLKDRDTSEAVRLAEAASRLAAGKDPVFSGTLAAAYASAGDFSRAVDAATRAIALAHASGNKQLEDVLRLQLASYSAGKPWFEPAP
jgi:protein O-mannosyl-transferase